jgi:hypothetical protein
MSLGSHNIQIAKINDRALVDTFIDFAKKSEVEIESMDFQPIFGSHINVPKGTDPNKTPEVASLLEAKSELINSLSIKFSSPKGRFTINASRLRDQGHDRLTVDFSAIQQTEIASAFKIEGLLRKLFKAIDSSDYIKSLYADSEKYFTTREQNLVQLEKVSSSLIVDQERYRQQLEQKFDERENLLNAEFQKKEEGLAQKHQELEKRNKEIDDRASKHARRATRESLKEIFNKRAESFKISSGTIALRNPIEIFSIILLAVFGLLFVTTALVSMKFIGQAQDADMISLYIKQATLGLAFASTAVFYIRWRNHWFERHAQEEFAIKRQEIDLDRATWAVELASEWMDEKKKEIPEALLLKITSNLFETQKTEYPKLHPADELSSAIFGASSSVKLKLQNGSEVGLDRKGIKQLQEPVD